MSNLKNYLFTSESVSEGHPDKVSDRISDMVVDSFISGDPYSRVACETLTTTNKVVLAGEVRGPEIKKDELIEKVRNCIKDIGYDQEGFTWKEATKIESQVRVEKTEDNTKPQNPKPTVGSETSTAEQDTDGKVEAPESEAKLKAVQDVRELTVALKQQIDAGLVSSKTQHADPDY